MLAHPSRLVDPHHATYDGEQLKRASDGVVLDLYDDERRGSAPRTAGKEQRAWWGRFVGSFSVGFRCSVLFRCRSVAVETCSVTLADSARANLGPALFAVQPR